MTVDPFLCLPGHLIPVYLYHSASTAAWRCGGSCSVQKDNDHESTDRRRTRSDAANEESSLIGREMRSRTQSAEKTPHDNNSILVNMLQCMEYWRRWLGC